jgi:FSR family fosmidomycin resistance protein-like MFS transporter
MRASSAAISQWFSQVGHSYSHIFMLLYPTVVLALEPEFGKSYGELLVLMTLGNVLFGVAALPAGWLGDRWSAAGMMVVFFIGTGMASLLTGLMHSTLGIAAGLSLIGLFASIYHPVGMAWLVRNAENRGRALGVNGVFGSLGVASAALIAGVLTDLIHWRAAFIIPGLVSLATGLGLWVLIRSGKVLDIKADVKPRAAPARGAMVRAFIVLSVTMLCTGLLFQSLSTAMPKIFAERLADLTGGTAAGAGLLVSVVYLFGMLGQLAGGHLADRYSLRTTYLWVYLMQIPVLSLAASLSGSPLFAVVTMAVLLNTIGIPVENSLLSHYSPEKWRGTAFGAKFVLALGISALGVPLVAILRDVTGDWYWYFMLMAAMAVLVVGASLALPSDRREATPRPAVTN